MMPDRLKSKLKKEFELMRDLEISARDLYVKAGSDPEVTDSQVRTAFRRIADDEQRHSELVDKIINIIETDL
jgi:rubrerythrin